MKTNGFNENLVAYNSSALEFYKLLLKSMNE